jgi:hypothetical protein
MHKFEHIKKLENVNQTKRSETMATYSREQGTGI